MIPLKARLLKTFLRERTRQSCLYPPNPLVENLRHQQRCQSCLLKVLIIVLLYKRLLRTLVKLNMIIFSVNTDTNNI